MMDGIMANGLSSAGQDSLENAGHNDQLQEDEVVCGSVAPLEPGFISRSLNAGGSEDVGSVDEMPGVKESRTGKRHRKRKAGREGADTPEALVRRETRVISIVKIIATGVTILASIIICGTVYFMGTFSEYNAFQAEYEALSHSVLNSLMEDTFRHFWMCRTLGSAINAMVTERLYFALSLNGTYNESDVERYFANPQTDFVIYPGIWDTLTMEMRSVTRTAMLSWSPLLRTDDERRRFETFAKEQENATLQGASNSTCSFCEGGPEFSVTLDSRLAIVDIPGTSLTLSCGELEDMGMQGALDSASCFAMQKYFSDVCVCEATGRDDTSADVIDRPVALGLFRAAANESSGRFELQTEEWERAPYLPVWSNGLLESKGKPIVFNQLSDPLMAEAFSAMLFNEQGTISKTYLTPQEKSFNYLASAHESTSNGSPFAAAFFPVRSPDGKNIMGAVSFLLPWSNLLTSTVPSKGEHVLIVIENSCQPDAMTFRVDPKGSNLQYEGIGDLHDTVYSSYSKASTYEEYDRLHAIISSNVGTKNNFTEADHCQYKFSVYPTSALENQYRTKDPIIYSASAFGTILLTSMIFVFYDSVVRRRQKILLVAAHRSNTIVTSLFPQNVRDRLYERTDQMNETAPDNPRRNQLVKRRKKAFTTQSNQSSSDDESSADRGRHTGSGESSSGDRMNGYRSVFGSAPIADLFPQSTIMFLDISGFTAWSSQREPRHVFTLLETLYHAFDSSAKELGVFKVETIGDCYVAAAGLPQPQEDHAVIMARFASYCLDHFTTVVQELHPVLGSSTLALQGRCGMHSGPITAGVLRGEKARFQLFGDTMNTASRMESTSTPSRIQCSQDTATLLQQAGKHHWITPREDTIVAKGKGEMKTFWIDPLVILGEKLE
jgi:class 3 adenylate cyclase